MRRHDDSRHTQLTREYRGEEGAATPKREQNELSCIMVMLFGAARAQQAYEPPATAAAADPFYSPRDREPEVPPDSNQRPFSGNAP